MKNHNEQEEISIRRDSQATSSKRQEQADDWGSLPRKGGSDRKCHLFRFKALTSIRKKYSRPP